MALSNKIKASAFTLLAAGAMCIPAAGQTAGQDVGFCRTVPTAVKDLLLEYKRDLTDLKTTLQAGPIPDSIIAGITSGRLEIHDRITYDSVTNQLRNIIFLVPPGLGIPTPPTYDFGSNTFLYIDVNVDKTYLSCSPYATVMFMGIVRQGVPLLGDPKGTPYNFSFGYNAFAKDPGKVFRDIGSVAAGIGVQYKDFAYGFISVANWPGENSLPAASGALLPPSGREVELAKAAPKAGPVRVTATNSSK